MAYRVKVGLRLRSSPTTTTDDNIIGSLIAGAEITPQGIEGDWAQLGIGMYCSAQKAHLENLEEDTAKLPPPSPPPVPPPTPSGWRLPFTATQRGVHANAGGWPPIDEDLAFIKHNRVEVVLIPAYEPNQARLAISRYRMVGVKHFIIRAATHAKITGDPNEFAQQTVPTLREYADQLGGSAGMMIAMHNEPNTNHEGFGSAWHSGNEFGGWLVQLAAIYRAKLPGCKLGFPALSPGGYAPNERADESTFARQARAAMLAMDWIGLHCYWTKQDGSDFAPPKSRWQELYFGKPWVGTEIGPAGGAKNSAVAVRKSYEWGAANNVPIISWLLNGAKGWDAAEWISNAVLL